MNRCVYVIGLAGVALGCRPATTEPQDTTASPQANAMPAPLANPPTPPVASVNSVTSLEAGPPLVAVRADAPVRADLLPKEPATFSLAAIFRSSGLSGPTRSSEVNLAGIEAAHKRTELALQIDVGPSRMRVVLGGNGYVLPNGTEIRARADRYGHVVVWPGLTSYRAIAPGALRALLGERRFDVAPLVPADVRATEETGKRLGFRTRHVDVETRVGTASIELGRVPELGEGGLLVCRMLLDLVSAPPATNACGVDEVPLRVELRWQRGGSLGFEITSVSRRPDLPSGALLVPPPTASFNPAPIPVAGVQAALSNEELAAFRLGPVEVGATDPDVTEGLVLVNATDELRVVVIDGVTAAWVAPGARGKLTGLTRGRYVVQWRTFLGDSVEPPTTVSVPGVAALGEFDGGSGGT